MGYRSSNPWMSMAEVAAAAALGGACAFAIANLLLAHGMVDGAAASSALTCGFVFVLAHAGLARLEASARHPLAAFALEPIPSQDEEPFDELLLDNIVAEPGPDARVVRLFDVEGTRAIRANADRHLNSGTDASEALHQALAELRRSLR